MLVAAAFVMFLAMPFVLPSGAVMGDWVQLSFVHERFAAELDRFYRRSVEPAAGWNNSPTVKRWVLFVGGALDPRSAVGPLLRWRRNSGLTRG